MRTNKEVIYNKGISFEEFCSILSERYYNNEKIALTPCFEFYNLAENICKKFGTGLDNIVNDGTPVTFSVYPTGYTTFKKTVKIITPDTDKPEATEFSYGYDEITYQFNDINDNYILDTNESWDFKLFDVNQTKYEPKEIEE